MQIWSNLKKKMEENSKVNVAQSSTQVLWIKASKGTKVPLITFERILKISSLNKGLSPSRIEVK